MTWSPRARRSDSAHEATRSAPGPSRGPSATPTGGLAVQLRALSPDARPGYQEQSAALSPQAAAAHGISGGGSALPYGSVIQASFGSHDISGVRATIGGRASEACGALGAEAYATGGSVAFAAPPSLHTAAHEAAHVVQQRAGVQLLGGVGEAGDRYERHADAVADLVVRGESAESLLSELAPAPGGSAGAVQLKRVNVAAGQFNDNGDAYKAINAGGQVGAEMGKLTFRPKIDLDAREVHLVQTVRDVVGDAHAYAALHQGNAGFGALRVAGGEHAGWGIDVEPYGNYDQHLARVMAARDGGEDINDDLIADQKRGGRSVNPGGVVTSADPRYAQQRTNAGVDPYAPARPPATQHTGYAARRTGAEVRVGFGPGRRQLFHDEAEQEPMLKWQPDTACIRDRPAAPKDGGCVGMEFEVAALAEGGNQGSQLLGSVRWGWTLNEDGRAELVELEVVSEGEASDAFFAAAAHWNALDFDDDQHGNIPAMQLPGRRDAH